MNINKIAIVFLALLVLLPLAAVATSAQQCESTLCINELEINGMDGLDSNTITVQRGEDIEIDVSVLAGQNDVEGMQIDAFISGYKYGDYERELVSDYTEAFDLDAGNKKGYDLKLKVPVDMETEEAKLRIVISDKNSPDMIVMWYQLNIKGTDKSEAIEIRNFLISPSEVIDAGRALSFKVKVKNVGSRTLDDVTVKVAVPELNIQAFETIDELDADESQTFEALLLRIPSDAKAGDYEVVATVEFDKYQDVSEAKRITVVGEQAQADAEDKTVVTMPNQVEVAKGTSGAVFPVLIENKAGVSKTYVVSASGAESFGTTTFEPSSVVIVGADSSKTVYMRIAAASDAEVGDRIFQVSVMSGEDKMDTAVVATVKEGDNMASSTGVGTFLEWALIILVVVLIILGLILVFVKMGKGKDDSDEETQTYY